MKYYIGMDIGGTSARMKAVDVQGKTLGEGKEKGCTLSTSGYDAARRCYREAVLPFLERCGLVPNECGGICIAGSGIDSPKLAGECTDIFLEMGFLEEAIAVYNDCEIILQLSEGPSMVIVAGTGSVAYGRASDGTTVRCGGWSHIVSDEGSAMDMGKMVIRAVGNHMDEREYCPVLYQLFIEETGLRTLSELDRYISENIQDKPKIAGLAVLTEKAAKMGDETAADIMRACIDALFLLVKDTYKKVKERGEEPRTLYLWGSVLTNNRVVSEGLKEKVNESYPNLEILYPDRSATETALLAAKRR